MSRVRFSRAGLTAASALALAGSGAWAQSANDFRLPSGSPTPTRRAQGPVTPDNPVVTPRPTPAPSPAPATPTPTVTAAPQPGTPSAGTPRPAPRRTTPLLPAPGPGLPAPAEALPTAAPSAVPPVGFPSPGASIASSPLAATPAASAGGAIWPWALGVLALLGVALGGLVWWRRRRDERPLAITFEPPVVPEAAPEPEPVAAPAPLPELEPVIAAPPPPLSPSPPPRGIALTLEATRMSASLMATTLSYKLKLTNHTETALSGLAIEGDMVAAQAQVPAERQVAQAAQHLEQRHALATLAPGESVEFAGDIRVPLNAIVPIQAGGHRLFIPLARFRVEAGADGRGRIAVTRTYVVGEEPEAAGAQLKPFRLDLGPRTYSRLGQRAVS